MIKIMITKHKKTPDHLVMIIQLMNIFMTCKDCLDGASGGADEDESSLGSLVTLLA